MALNLPSGVTMEDVNKIFEIGELVKRYYERLMIAGLWQVQQLYGVQFGRYIGRNILEDVAGFFEDVKIGRTEARMHLYSAHDTTLTAIFAGLGAEITGESKFRNDF